MGGLLDSRGAGSMRNRSWPPHFGKISQPALAAHTSPAIYPVLPPPFNAISPLLIPAPCRRAGLLSRFSPSKAPKIRNLNFRRKFFWPNFKELQKKGVGPPPPPPTHLSSLKSKIFVF